MKSKEVINKDILRLERDKGQVLKDVSFTLNYLKEQIDKGNIDRDTFGILTKLFNGVSTIDEQLQLLYDIRKEISES